MTTIAVYVSGHGFGHSTRVAEVLCAVRRSDPGSSIAIVTKAPSALYREAGFGPFSFRDEDCDVGLVQHGALEIDHKATAARWREFMSGWERRVEAEAVWLRSSGARLVLGDVPPLAFAAASRAGIPGIALTNFSWDWIYRHLSRHEPALEEAAGWAASAYAKADLLLRLPFYGDLSAFRLTRDVSLVARRPRVQRGEARRRLGLPDRPVVLLSFGGLGLRRFDPRVLADLRDYLFVTTASDPGTAAVPENMRPLTFDVLRSLGLGYIDLVGASDVVVTKPGYGIVTDCIGAGTRIVYTDRGDFPEYPILVSGLREVLPSAFIGNDDLRTGRLAPAIEDVLARPVPPPPDLSGADQAAAHLLEQPLR